MERSRPNRTKWGEIGPMWNEVDPIGPNGTELDQSGPNRTQCTKLDQIGEVSRMDRIGPK